MDTSAPLSKSPTLARARTRTSTSLTSHSSAASISASRSGSDVHRHRPVVDPALLPKSNSPTLRLVQCTPAELLRQQRNHAAQWRGSLSVEQYIRREHVLASQDLTRDGGMTFWALTDDSLPRVEADIDERHHNQGTEATGGYSNHSSSGERVVLAGCETFRKRAFLVRRREDGGGGGGGGKSGVREVVCHGVGSVFCPVEFRGRGYAGAMMRMLSERLSRHQTRLRDGRPVEAAFSVLYSDIGREFYDRNGGWEVFESRHVELPAVPPSSQIIEGATASFPLTRRLKTEDLPSLCLADETLLRRSLERLAAGGGMKDTQQGAGSSAQGDGESGDKDIVAIVPDVQTIMWMHAREDFVCQEIFTRYPEIKGAIVGMGEGKHAWCYWVRMYYNDDAGGVEGNTLYVIRIAVEPGLEGTLEGEVGCAALLQAAQREAHGWHMEKVVVWNPSGMVQRAAARALGKKPDQVPLVDRASDSICALRWYGDGNARQAGTARQSVQWVANEKFAWC